MKCFIGAAMLPKRVGLPSSRPAHCSRSCGVAYGGPSSGISGSVASLCADTGGTVRRRAAQPLTESTPRAM